MANVLITNVCNANCAFCFAQEQTQLKPQYLDPAVMHERIAWIQESGLKQVRLMGGEPTLHPQFIEIAQKVIDADLTLVIFSNGFVPESALRFLVSLPKERCAVLLNVNAVHRMNDEAFRRNHLLSLLGEKVTLGATILNPVFDLSLYFDWITQFHLQSRLRLGLAQPIYGGQNMFLHPKHYRTAALSILANAKVAIRTGIHLEFDCGFVRCMFTADEWLALEKMGVAAESHCAPNVDIGMNGSVFHCFSLSQMAVPLADCVDTKMAVRHLEMKRSQFRLSGIYPGCVDCEDRINGRCCGGCLSLVLRRFHPDSISF